MVAIVVVVVVVVRVNVRKQAGPQNKQAENESHQTTTIILRMTMMTPVVCRQRESN